MSKNELRKQMLTDREALQTWWAGDRAKPFILEKQGRDYCVCYLLFQTLTENLRLSRKCLWCWLAEKTPFSACKVFFYRRAGVKIGMMFLYRQGWS